MASQTSAPISQPQTDFGLSALLNMLVRPAEAVTGDDRNKAFSLAALTLIFIPLTVLTVFAPLISDFISGVGLTAPNVGGMIAIILVSCAYGMSRTKYYQIGSYLIISVPLLAVIVTALASETVVSDTALFYLSLSIILSSLLLSSRDTLVAGIVVGVTSIVLYLITNDNTTPYTPNVLTFIIVTTGVMSLISRIRENNLEQLELAQAELQRRIVEVDEARIQAERSDQVKSTFLASMSHELRTPLNAIINFTRFVIKGTVGPVSDKQIETLDHVVVSGKHLLNLINDVLDMSKIESGSLNLFVSDDVDLASIANDVSATAKTLLGDKTVDFKTDVDEVLPLMRGDQQRIRQILLNLVSNACKFTDEGEIMLSIKQQGEDILLTLTDTGSGIADEDQGLVFEAFKQTTGGLRQGGGTGLGMPITKSLVEAHGGNIQLDSALGQGTTFHICLPIKSKTLTPTLVTEI